MNYAAMYDQAMKDGRTRELSPVFFKWTEEDQTIIGKLIGRNLVKSRAATGEYIDYVVDTDDGVRQFHCGSQFDERIGTTLTIGSVYAWTFKGKRDVGKGHRVNDFSCVAIGVEPGASPAGADNPL